MKRNGRGHLKATRIFPLPPDHARARNDIGIDALKTVGIKLDRAGAAKAIESLVSFLASEDSMLEITGERSSSLVRFSSRNEHKRTRKSSASDKEFVSAPSKEKHAPTAKRVAAKRRPKRVSQSVEERQEQYYRALEGDADRKKKYMGIHDTLVNYLTNDNALKYLRLHRRKDLGRYGCVLETYMQGRAIAVEATLDERWPASVMWPSDWENAIMSMPAKRDPLYKIFPDAWFLKINESLTRCAMAPMKALVETPLIGYKNDHEQEFSNNRFHWLYEGDPVHHFKMKELVPFLKKIW